MSKKRIIETPSMIVDQDISKLPESMQKAMGKKAPFLMNWPPSRGEMPKWMKDYPKHEFPVPKFSIVKNANVSLKDCRKELKDRQVNHE